MSQYSNLIITNRGIQAYKKCLRENMSLTIAGVIAVQNSTFKKMTTEQIKNLSIENGDFNSLGKTAYMTLNTSDHDLQQHIETAIELHATIDNSGEIENGMTIDGIILITFDPSTGLSVPLAVSKAIDPEIIPPKKDDDITYTFTADLLLNVDRTDKISVKYSPNGLVKRKELEKHEEEADDKYAKKIDTYTKIETNREIQNAKPKKLKWGTETNGGYINNPRDPQGEFNFGYDYDTLYLNPKRFLESITYSLVKDDYLLVSHAQLTQALKEDKTTFSEKLDKKLDKKVDKTDFDKEMALKMDLKVTDIDTSNASKYNLNTDLFSQKALEGRYRFVTTAASQSLGIPKEVRFVPFYLQITKFGAFQEQKIVASNSLVPIIYRRIIGKDLTNSRTWYKFTGTAVEG